MEPLTPPRPDWALELSGELRRFLRQIGTDVLLLPLAQSAICSADQL